MEDYLSIQKKYSVRIGEFTVFLEARDKKNKGPRAMHLNRQDLDCHPNLRHAIFVFAITPNVLLFHHRDSRMTPIYVISDIMHPELVVSERSSRGDGIAISSRVKILESRLDMTKRARKTLNDES